MVSQSLISFTLKNVFVTVFINCQWFHVTYLFIPAVQDVPFQCSRVQYSSKESSYSGQKHGSITPSIIEKNNLADLYLLKYPLKNDTFKKLPYVEIQPIKKSTESELNIQLLFSIRKVIKKARVDRQPFQSITGFCKQSIIHIFLFSVNAVSCH